MYFRSNRILSPFFFFSFACCLLFYSPAPQSFLQKKKFPFLRRTSSANVIPHRFQFDDEDYDFVESRTQWNPRTRENYKDTYTIRGGEMCEKLWNFRSTRGAFSGRHAFNEISKSARGNWLIGHTASSCKPVMSDSREERREMENDFLTPMLRASLRDASLRVFLNHAQYPAYKTKRLKMFVQNLTHQNRNESCVLGAWHRWFTGSEGSVTRSRCDN